jgi:hypothetical protein
MKLHYNVASPFVRKVMAVAIETGWTAGSSRSPG